jgi:hypothetical protein
MVFMLGGSGGGALTGGGLLDGTPFGSGDVALSALSDPDGALPVVPVVVQPPSGATARLRTSAKPEARIRGFIAVKSLALFVDRDRVLC